MVYSHPISNILLMIILKLILEKYEGGVSWIHLAQDSDQWQAAVNEKMNSGFHNMLGVS
jgi:hypothetical protein